MHSVTGLELYHFERAGLLVRRAAPSDWTGHGQPRAIPVSARECAALFESSGLLLVAQDLLGGTCQVQVIPPGSPSLYAAHWHRISGPACDAPAASQAAELARASRALYCLVAFRPCAALEVLPGSHAEAPEGEQAASLRSLSAAAVPGAVRIRLAAGDAAILHPALIGRRREDEACGCRQVVVTSGI